MELSLELKLQLAQQVDLDMFKEYVGHTVVFRLGTPGSLLHKGTLRAVGADFMHFTDTTQYMCTSPQELIKRVTRGSMHEHGETMITIEEELAKVSYHKNQISAFYPIE